jgi:hypothetical protein
MQSELIAAVVYPPIMVKKHGGRLGARPSSYEGPYASWSKHIEYPRGEAPRPWRPIISETVNECGLPQRRPKLEAMTRRARV